ncbi:tubulin-specific chaperone D [Rhodotorula toruloides]|uniref:Tubulin-specific chaperone D n=1 Tax=Rhodotorula toruloides TaxID=5286 RepID=A0A511KKZ5_RHOTO|nr:tubulin-specific chaperone D [Rhodotorula toruloides]
MSTECDDAPAQLAFARIEEFLRDATRLANLDFDSEPSREEEREERAALGRLCAMLDDYQEQSYLLDPSLETLVSPLLTSLRVQVRRQGSKLGGRRIERVAKILYWFTKVRGSKTIAQFFPHEVTDLAGLVQLLSADPDAPSTSSTPLLSSPSWELRYILLLWLSVCIRLPFALSRLTPGTKDAIEALGLKWLERSGKEADGAAEVLGRYFARNDVDIACLLEWSEDALRSSEKQKTAETSGADHEDVPEEVELIVGELIEGLAHPDSIPRYSSAKYLARLSLLLPTSFASQVLDAILTSFEEALAEASTARGEGKAQGACLAVGEMARRGVLNRLETEERDEVVKRVLDCTLQALNYDHLTVLHSIGTSVRDSASYVLWSLSRTLSSSSLSAKQAQGLAERLVCTACLDREVSVRRAASAAWQEAVGRWGIFPHGISVLRLVDFFTVSVRHRAFLQAAVGVAGYPEYRLALVSHLLGRPASSSGTAAGIAHYDAEIRSLSAQALGLIVEGAAEELAERLIDEQVKKLDEVKKDAGRLHGVLLSLAHLAKATQALPTSAQGEAFKAQPSTRSLKSNQLVLSAALSALASSAPTSAIAAANTRLPPNWFDLVHLACDRSEQDVHEKACEAIAAVSKAVDCCQQIDSLLADLDSRSGTRQQAAVLLLGQINYSHNHENSEKLAALMRRLFDFVQREGPRKAATIEGRRNGVEAMAAILIRDQDAGTLEPLLDPAVSALQLGFTDYTSDQRGDVGSWVRISTLSAWSTLIASLYLSRLDRHAADQVIAKMVKLCLERLDNVREAAGEALMSVWAWQIEGDGGSGGYEGSEGLLRGEEVWRAIAAEERQNWRDLNWSSERILPLLQVAEYRADLLEGAVLSMSQFSSSTAFVDFCLSLPALPPASAESDNTTSYSLVSLLSSLLALGKTQFTSNRILVPLLSTLATLAEAGCLDEVAANETGEGANVLRDLIGVVVNGVGKMKSSARLTGAVKVVVAFLPLPNVGTSAATRLHLFLAHPQPWLRQQAADELFGALAAIGSEDQELQTMLAETSWSGLSKEEATRKGRAVEEKVKAAVELSGA